MGAVCFMRHSKWASRTSGGSLGRFALARVAARRIGGHYALGCRRQPPTRTLLHPLTPTDTAGPRRRTPKGRGWDVLGPTSIYASYTPQTEC